MGIRFRIYGNKKLVKKEDEHNFTTLNPNRKIVFGFIDGKLKAQWDSITLCGNALGLTRNVIKKHIESGDELESGYILKLTNK